MSTQGIKVKVKSTGRTGVVESGIPFSVANRKYVEVRWDDNGTVSTVGLWTIVKTK